MNKMARSNRRNAVLGVQLAHERAWQPRGGLNEDAFKRLGLVQSASNQSLLERLEAENAQLRGSVVDLVLQIQALCDALGHPQSDIRPNSVGLVTSLPSMRLPSMRCR
jgi:hypothetical protein